MYYNQEPLIIHEVQNVSSVGIGWHFNGADLTRLE